MKGITITSLTEGLIRARFVCYAWGVGTLLAASAYAEIKNCGGILTNQECPEGGETMVIEKPYATLEPAEEEKQQKQKLLSDLRTAVIKANDSHGVSVNLDITERVCMMSTLDQCAQVVMNKEKEVNALVVSAQQAKERAKIKDVPTPAVIKQPAVNSNASVITVIQNNVNTKIDNGRRAQITPIKAPSGNRRTGEAPLLTDQILPSPGVLQPRKPKHGAGITH